MIGTALGAAAARLAASSDSARLDAELLLAHVLGIDRGALRARDSAPLPPEAAARFAGLVERRTAGEPLAYLTGRREFWTLALEVGPAVLVPRPETELLVEWALARLGARHGARLLDLGAGSGAVGLALASERPDARVDLVEASAAAAALAERNRVRLGLGNARVLNGDWYAPLGDARYALVVSNPPYIAAGDPALAAPELAHEPRAALVAGPDGLEALAAIAGGAPAHLEPGGALIAEHGATQGPAVRELWARAGLAGIETRRDLAGHERATLGVRPG